MPRFHVRSSTLLLALVLSSACAGTTPEAQRPPILFGLPGVVDSVRNTPPLDRTHWGIGAYDVRADRMVLRVNLDHHFVPASNMKLVTTAVALGTLGPDYRYRTRVFAENLSDGAATALVVRGSGDPTLGARFHGGHPMAAAASIADSIVASGVRTIRGPLVVDATFFDDQSIHPTWEIGDLDWYYAAPVAAFAMEEGTITIMVYPGANVGDSATIDVIAPAGIVHVENAVVTDTAFSENTIEFVRPLGMNAFRFSGSIPLGAEADGYEITIADPAGHAGRVLAGMLAQRGVTVDSVIVVNSGSPQAPQWNTQLARFTEVAVLESPRMSEIVEAILEPSNNWIAEQVLKTLGAELGDGGTWRAGAAVATRYLAEQAGVDSAAVHIVDGSGLSAQNLLSPDAIMRLLYHASEQPWGPIYRGAMPEPGEVESTLENRLIGYEGRVFAKTGSITHVNSLSGYVITADGREVIFSILSNASGVRASQVRAGIDRIVEALASLGTVVTVPEPEVRLAP
ncbi:MAG TPA: D-alanyl-D-alanine carboxypeptidase/D-alanyl-D-alanine-endopeptidase [Longimicrobiales bacterium]